MGGKRARERLTPGPGRKWRVWGGKGGGGLKRSVFRTFGAAFITSQNAARRPADARASTLTYLLTRHAGRLQRELLPFPTAPRAPVLDAASYLLRSHSRANLAVWFRKMCNIQFSGGVSHGLQYF